MKLLGLITAILLLAPTVLANSTPEEYTFRPLNASRSVDEIIVDRSTHYGVSAPLMRQIVQCESQYRNIQSEIPSTTGPNGREDSWGVVQIHLPDWPEITRDMALDHEFAIDFLASKLSNNQGYLWTCYRNMVR